MESQPQPESTEDVVATQAAIAAKLAEAEEAIHPMAKAIPSLHQAIKRVLAQKNIGKHRYWSSSPFRHALTRWRNTLTTNEKKPELLEFLAALAAHKALYHKEYDAFTVLIEHRQLVVWAEKQMKEWARRQNIDLVKALENEHPEMAQKIKHEPDEEESEAPSQAAVQVPQQLSQVPAAAPAPETPQQQSLNSVSLRYGSENPRQATSLRITRPKTVFQQPLEPVQPAIRAPTKEATQPVHQDQTNREEGSVRPLKRSIECPSGAVCPHEPKKPKTRDFGCQVNLTAPKSRPQQDKPRQEAAQPYAMPLQQSTPPATPHVRQEDGLITAVKELVQSNVESQQSNRAIQQSMQDMAQSMYWQQQQQQHHQRALMPPMAMGVGMYGQMPQLSDYGMMMAPGQLGLQYFGGGRAWGGHQATQRATGRGMTREVPRQRSVMPESQRVTKEGREEGEGRDGDSAKDQSRFFQ